MKHWDELARALAALRRQKYPELLELAGLEELVQELLQEMQRAPTGARAKALAEELSQILLAHASGENTPKLEEYRRLLQRSHRKAIYGEDDRLDVRLIPEPVPKLARNIRETALLVRTAELAKRPEGGWRLLKPRTLNDLLGGAMAEGERFRDAGVAGFGSGFLVDPTHVITAKHCTWNRHYQNLEPAQIMVVFGFHQTEDDTAPTAFEDDQVFALKAIKRADDALDWAVLELARPVPGAQGLPLAAHRRGDSPVRENLSLYVVGHPMGLTKKYAPGATVTHVGDDSNHFIANTDTFRGNSGSPVFDALTHSVVGVLVRGDQDYKPNAQGQLQEAVYPAHLGREVILRVECVELPSQAKLFDVQPMLEEVRDRIKPLTRREIATAFGRLLPGQRAMVLIRCGLSEDELTFQHIGAQMLAVAEARGVRDAFVAAIREEAPAFLPSPTPDDEHIAKAYAKLIPGSRAMVDMSMEDMEGRVVQPSLSPVQVGVALVAHMDGNNARDALIAAIREQAPAFL